jgi:hypothetical protein
MRRIEAPAAREADSSMGYPDGYHGPLCMRKRPVSLAIVEVFAFSAVPRRPPENAAAEAGEVGDVAPLHRHIEEESPRRGFAPPKAPLTRARPTPSGVRRRARSRRAHAAGTPA